MTHLSYSPLIRARLTHSGLLALLTFALGIPVGAIASEHPLSTWSDRPALATPAAALEEDNLTQVTSVSQLADVQPTDWAFQALQSLVERYGCIAGYPDGTFKGDRPLNRYEFAAGLNACLDHLNDLITSATDPLARKADLGTLQALQEAFAAELASLRGSIAALESRTSELATNQFSPATKLQAEAMFALADVWGDEQAGGNDLDDNATFAYWVRLNFNTSFTGKDELRVRFQSNNIVPIDGEVTGTSMTRLGFDGNSNNQLRLGDLYYRFPLGDRTRAWLIANGHGTDGITDPLNVFLRSDSSGALSRFGRFSSIYRGVRGPGMGIQHRFNRHWSADLAYRAPRGSSPADESGLFNGSYGILGQILYQPSATTSVGFTFTHTYFDEADVNLTDNIGSAFAQRPFDRVDTQANSYGLIGSVQFSPRLNLSGWVAYTDAQAKSGGDRGAHADIWTWAVTLAFPDLFKDGNVGGLVVGMPPKATHNDLDSREDRDTSLHLEALYRHRLTDNIAITPGIIAIINPEHYADNSTQVVGVIRTTFAF
ncbi:MAG: hypothetical protein EA001_01640 [Oscillatoriales cyanobacterium]|nr:MAG: hypothetical protein EA001_01640 [Oscillatoriales cyanobacterium]